jgi:hypothetical protein
MAESDREKERAKGGDAGELKVTDRRLFTLEGELRDGLAEEPEPPSETPPPAEKEERTEQPEEPSFEHRPIEEPRGVDFTMLINAMAQPALIFLGEIPHPGTGQPEVNLEQARLQIDLLDLLRIRCRGNLTQEEEGLLERMLYQLRMLYVARSSQPGE